MGRAKNSNFLIHGAILAVSSLVVRLIGLIYRIPLNNILGEKGIAYYGVAFDVYSILLLLSSYSLPLAVSKMVASRVTLKEYKNTQRIFLLAICFALVTGVAAFCITFFGARFFANLLHFPQAEVALRVLSPALIILAIMGVLRGYFQGLQTMIPTAVSNIIEQIVNAAVSILAAKALFDSAQDYDASLYAFNNVPEAYGAAGGTLGTVCGAAVALIFLIGLFIARTGERKRFLADDMTKHKETVQVVLRILVLTIVPVIVSTAIYNISSLLDTGFFGNIMASKGMDQEMTDTLWGMYSGNYRLIINVPIALASAMASSLIPSLVESRTEGNKEAVKVKVRAAVKVSMMVAMPCAVGIAVLSKPIINMLFPKSVDPDKVALMLIVGAVSVILYTLSTITNSILQGIDRMSLPVRHSAISLVIHIAFLLGMLYLTDMNIFAVILADILFTLVICILNAASLYKNLHFKQEKINSFVKPAVSSVIMGIFSYLAFLLFKTITNSNTAAVIISIIVSVIVYFAALVLTRTISSAEMSMMPMGSRLARLLKKVGR